MTLILHCGKYNLWNLYLLRSKTSSRITSSAPGGPQFLVFSVTRTWRNAVTVPLGDAIGMAVLSDISSSCQLVLLPFTCFIHPGYKKTFLTSKSILKPCAAGRPCSSLDSKRACLYATQVWCWKNYWLASSWVLRKMVLLSGHLKILLHKGLKKKEASSYLDFVPVCFPSASSSFPLRCELQSASQIRLFIPSLPPGIFPPEHHFHLPQLLWWPVNSATHVLTHTVSARIQRNPGSTLKEGVCK